ncbi:Ycf66 family protein [Aphanothece sacrum]|uniref:Ycf66 family protein n=1 Tax=Aphanothece sacrum FPU1 TaxID=1920663 RepID=A0A401ICV7_APHSA|nr:Ycf66 family protein [Aphanothece sacrum]GBF79071.1 Ycf66 family protein [Aphanothece sacrum FPU1]GBF86029.1 Ycf66 family protein [Aphanothece sacrum FPU3]
MVNFGLNSASILGIFLAVAGAGLYFLRSVRPELSRDHDIFFAAVGLLCGLILLFQGWRLDPILQFGQFLLTGAAIFFAVETIKLRGATTEQARRNSPIVDNERRVSKTRVYTEAELDQIEPYEEEQEEGYRNNRRLRGYEEPRSPRRSNYSQEEPRTSKTRRPADSYGDTEPPRKRPSRPGSSKPESYDAWEESSDMWEERPKTPRPRRPRPDSQPPETSQRPPRKRPSRPSGDQERYPTRSSQSTPTDYVDYQPIDPPMADQGTIPPSDEDLRGDRPDDNNPNRFDY